MADVPRRRTSPGLPYCLLSVASFIRYRSLRSLRLSKRRASMVSFGHECMLQHWETFEIWLYICISDSEIHCTTRCIWSIYGQPIRCKCFVYHWNITTAPINSANLSSKSFVHALTNSIHLPPLIPFDSFIAVLEKMAVHCRQWTAFYNDFLTCSATWKVSVTGCHWTPRLKARIQEVGWPIYRHAVYAGSGTA